MGNRVSPVAGVVGMGFLLLVGCTGSPAMTDATSAATSSSSAATPLSTAVGASSGSVSTTRSTTPTASANPLASTAPSEITPVLAAVSTEPVPVTGTNGNTYLVYELYLTNATSTPVTIDSVQAVDPDSGAVLQSQTGDDLIAHTRVIGATPGGPPATSMVLNGGQLGIVWLDPNVAAGAQLPKSLTHQVKLTFASAPNPLVPAELTENVATATVQTVPPPTISSPLAGQNWLDGNGCCDELTPHRGASNPINGQYFFAERFAIDFVQVTADRQIATGDIAELSSYPFYGSPIHAVADGTIVAVSDVLQDQVPGSNPPVGSLTLDQFGGNHVVQRFEQNGQTYYALYAHLKPGSTKGRVTVGQTVRTGDQVGDLGNSGNTDVPHLHFHVMDGPDPLASNGLPYLFDSMQLVGEAAGDEAIDTMLKGQPLALAPSGETGERLDVMPLYLDLVDFPAAQSSSPSASPSSSPSATSSTGRSSSVPSAAPTSG